MGILSIVPPILAIILALTTKEVVLSLFVAIFVGAIILNDMNILLGFTETLNTFVVGSLTDSWNASILLFCLSIGGLINVLQKNGGTLGISNIVINKTKGRKSSLIMTWLLGLLIFFDDYANSLIVGNTMKSVTDKLKVPREKLAYIIDSTAAPVSSIALVSTWVGMELGLIQTGLENIGVDKGSYQVFLETIPYRFYSILTLGFVLAIIILNKDFSLMAKAEKNCSLDSNTILEDEKNSIDNNIKPRWYNAVLPILTVILVTMIGLFINGGGLEGETIQNAYSNADASVVLLWASIIGFIVATFMTLVQKTLSFNEIMESWIDGIKDMIVPALILILAWSLGSINGELKTANYIVSLIGNNFPAFLIPTIMFIISAIIAFSTGSSWATNAIVMPIAISLGFKLGGISILIPVIGSVLTGAVLGDHCSIISDTTIMSSMASGCNHISHVKTQMPYAMTVGLISIITGFIPAGLGLNPFISLTIGMISLIAIIYKFGKKNN